MNETALVTARSIVMVRTIALFMGMVILVTSGFWLALFPVSAILYIALGVHTGWVLFAWWRLRYAAPIGSLEIFTYLVVDVLILTLVLYASGGSSNPFISYFFVLISLAAVNLSHRLVWIITGLTVVSYSVLTFGTSGMEGHHHHDDAFNLHLLGMWINFCLGAVLITYFVSAMAKALKDNEQQMAKMREDALHHEQVLAMGILAASTSHEMSTPLSTVSLLLGEARLDQRSLTEDEMETAAQQIKRCKSIISTLTRVADYKSLMIQPPLTVIQFIEKLRQDLALLKPGAGLDWQLAGCNASSKISSDPTLVQAVLNVLINAIEASREQVIIETTTGADRVILTIKDDGPGISNKILQDFGRQLQTTKQEGIGIGLFLSNATIERLGGAIKVVYSESTGSCVEINIPQMMDKPT